MQSEANRVKEEAQQALRKELMRHQQTKQQLENNKTLCDGLERQLERLHLEKATLQSDSSDIRERQLH